MLHFDRFSVVVLLCAVVVTLFIVDIDNNSVPDSPGLPEDVVGFAVHPLSSSFSTAESGVHVTGSLLSVSDNVVYRMGFYSVNGSSWVPFNMSGSPYNGNANWMRGYASRYLPTFGPGEHYILIYSCNRSNGARVS